MKKEINFEAIIGLKINNKNFDEKLFESLYCLSKTYSQRKSAKKLGISHSVFNRRIKKYEKELGFKLVKTIGSGSELTEEAIKILNQFKIYKKQLAKREEITIAGGHITTGLLNSISDKLPFDISVYSSDDENGYKLAVKNLVDILALDDPLIAFEKNLNFTPIAYDYLVLISGKESKKINNINDLNNLKFISVKGTAQRLAWNTLKSYNIPFKIKREVKSQFDAFKIVKNSKDTYTFLNASYFKGNDILKKETQHVISLIQVNDDDKVSKFVNYILHNISKEIEKEGFEPIKKFY